MKIRKLLILFVTFSLCSCNKVVETSPENKLVTIDSFGKKDLPMPSNTIKNVEDMAYALDYMAFYRISDKVSFYMPSEYRYTFNGVFNKGYEMADLADVYAAHIDDHMSEGYVTIYYSMSKDVASNTPSSFNQYGFIKDFNYNYSSNINNNIDLYINSANLEEISCETSEQLFYLVQKGYKPKPVKDSMADIIYKKAISILNSIIKNEDSDFFKIKAVYDYLTEEVAYDFNTAYSQDTYLVKVQAYYLEGVFLNNYAVCDGKSKAYSLLLNMLGIKCLRLTASYTYEHEKYDHAFNVINLDDNWYISCTTYGSSLINFKDIGKDKMFVASYNMMLQNKETGYGNQWLYVPVKHYEEFNNVSDKPYDVFKELSNNGINYIVNDIEDVTKLVSLIDRSNTKIEFIYKGNDETFELKLLDYVSSFGNNYNIIKPLYNDGQIYQFIKF